MAKWHEQIMESREPGILNIPGTKSGKNISNDGSKLSEKSCALFESKEIDRSDLILPNCLAVKFTYFNKIRKSKIFPDNISKSGKRAIWKIKEWPDGIYRLEVSIFQEFSTNPLNVSVSSHNSVDSSETLESNQEFYNSENFETFENISTLYSRGVRCKY